MEYDYFVVIIAVLALLYAVYLAFRVRKQDVGSTKTKELMDAIHEGAMAFLNKE